MAKSRRAMQVLKTAFQSLTSVVALRMLTCDPKATTESPLPTHPSSPYLLRGFMAEAAGLALGAVALVSLFQTAVEFLEYFEIAKSLRADQDLATTKINLLEVRLKQWGQEIHIQDVGQEWEGWLRRQEGGIITNCLIGISNILGNANQLTSKYGLDRTRKPGWLSPFSGLTRSSSDSRRSASKTNTFTPASATIKFSRESSTSVGSRVTWAIKDKKRFESLISELDFLITNLERVSGRLHHQDTSPSSHSSSQARVFPTPQG